MSRYTDADALKEYFVDLSTEKDIGFGDASRMITVNINHIIKVIENAPSIDIVFCKECKRFGDEGWCFWRDVAIKADDFCSYGERRK